MKAMFVNRSIEIWLKIDMFNTSDSKYIAKYVMDRSISQSAILREVWEQGWQNGLTQVALNMLQAKIDPAQVATLTGLSTDRINSIQREAANLENFSQLDRDWQNLRESSLAEIWLNEEEDKAWQDL
ncbi:hypothetical protein [Chamaesiphon sp.]|uniref:hypothetical protein n=1 Tax=Chamaesiphon sp. TaxID=2814140 RepID=UPI0035933E1C